MSHNFIDEVVKVDISASAGSPVSNYAHRQFAVLGEFLTPNPQKPIHKVNNIDELNNLGLAPISFNYIKKWFDFTNNFIYVIDRVNIASIPDKTAIIPLNILLDTGNSGLDHQIAAMEIIEALPTEAEAKVEKFYYFNVNNDNLQAGLPESILNSRKNAIFIDNNKDGRWFEHLAVYSNIGKSLKEFFEVSTLPYDEKLGLDGGDGYYVGNFETYLIKNKVAGIYRDDLTMNNKSYNVRTTDNVPIRLNFLACDIKSDAQIGAYTLLIKGIYWTAMVANLLSKVMQKYLSNIYGFQATNTQASIISVSNPPFSTMKNQGIFSGYIIKYRARLYGAGASFTQEENI